eukprot:165217_1
MIEKTGGMSGRSASYRRSGESGLKSGALRDNLVDCGKAARLLQREVSDAIESNDHSVDILDHVLDLSKLEAKKLILNNDPMNVHTVCVSALGTMHHLAKPGVKLLLQCYPELWIFGSPRHFKQIVINLLSN